MGVGLGLGFGSRLGLGFGSRLGLGFGSRCVSVLVLEEKRRTPPHAVTRLGIGFVAVR